MDTPFIVTRTLATLFGGWLLVFLIGALFIAIESLMPPRAPVPSPSSGEEGEAEVHYRSSCWERRPFRDLAQTLLFSVLPISGMVLVWWKPRIGFRLTAGGWALMFVAGPLTLLEPSLDHLGDWRFWVLLLIPSLWLCFASLKVPTPTRTPAL
jgi:hypothetical protein